jgi:hypothetical protein
LEFNGTVSELDSSVTPRPNGPASLPAPSAAVRAGWPDRAWLLFLLAASSLWCVTASPQIGPTFDEPNYIANGLERWRSGSYRRLMRQGTMPLPIDVATGPLYVWERWRGDPFKISSNDRSQPVTLDDLSTVLPIARLGTLPFWWLLLIYAWRLGWLAGPWGGRLALPLVACEPNLLAHATLATTDIAVTSCLLAFSFHFVSGRAAHWTRRVLIPGGLFGLALLAKASALVFGPICMFAIELHRLLKTSNPASDSSWPAQACAPAMRSIRSSLRDGRQIAVLGLAVAYIYVGTEFQVERSFVSWAHDLPEGAASRCLVGVAENLRVFPNAGQALAFQVKHNVRGHGVYLLGETHHRALWYYFPVVLAVKLNLAVLALALAIVCLCPRALWNPALAVAALILLLSAVYRVQIGVRLILPLVAMLLVGLAAAVSIALAEAPSAPRRMLCGSAAAMACVWASTSAAFAWPDALAYSNELFRSPAHGRPALSDSNLDWGQGLMELDRWRQQRGLRDIDVWYFGTDPAHRQAPFRAVPLHGVDVADMHQLAALVAGPYLAVSTTLLYGAPLNDQHRRSAALLQRLEPVDRTTTYFIFDVSANRRLAGMWEDPLHTRSR